MCTSALRILKFGGDSLGEMKRNFEGYREQLRGYLESARPGASLPDQ